MVLQDLVKHYGRKQVKPSCLMKIDLQKAYDIISWEFLDEMLSAPGFPTTFKGLIMECVSTPMFSIILNGTMRGFFKSSRGLRQGDPISLLLFVLCIEYLSIILTKLTELEQFQYHPRCKEMKLTHMCFADDLIMCCKGEYVSAYLMLRAFKLFSETSGLKANVGKSAMFNYCFVQQSLPFTYLGISICANKLIAAQCEVLTEKMTARIRVWSSRNLSYSARVQLINYVLLSLHMYWAQVFLIPKKVLHDICMICRAFLWSGQYFCQKPGAIAWEKLCQPKSAGGLGFRNVLNWNVAFLGKYVWAVSYKQDSVWLI